MRKLSLFALLLGLGLTGYLLNKIGVGQIWEMTSRMGWSVLILIPLALIWILPNTRGLACAIHPNNKKFSFNKLIVTRLVGESVNYLTPSGYLGGEPVKATIMASSLGIGNSMSAVMVAKTAQTLGLLIFVLTGLFLAHWTVNLPPAAKTAAAGAILLLSLGVLVMILCSTGKMTSKLTYWGSTYFKNSKDAKR